jgi:hypothetical protein
MAYISFLTNEIAKTVSDAKDTDMDDQERHWHSLPRCPISAA